mgnify:CR=1 FL=1
MRRRIARQEAAAVLLIVSACVRATGSRGRAARTAHGGRDRAAHGVLGRPA